MQQYLYPLLEIADPPSVGQDLCHSVNEMSLNEYISADPPYSGLSKEQLLECAYRPAWVRVRKALLVAFWVSWFALLCLAISLIVLTPKCVSPPPIVWWQREPVYHLYVSSWQDGLYGDGVGDLTGIESKLDYIKDIGVGTIWLSPIYSSPMKDFGYDISNFTDISPVYGTMDDFRSLVKSMKEKGLKLVMDFVPNHSSSEHQWFQKSVQRIEPYSDYYIWVDPNGFNIEGKPMPPNNWISVFGGSAWEWSKTRQQFYLHQFLKEQPDLNYRNPVVLKEMKDVMQFWLDEGVDGFRMDAVAHIFEDEQLRDEPIDDEDSDDEYQQLDHIYTFNLPGVLDVLREFRVLLDQNSDQHTKIMMVEAYLPVEDLMPYYGNQSTPIAHFPFNFELISSIKSNITAQKVHDVIKSWMNEMPAGAWPNWVAGNHDNSRVATRFGRELVDAMNMILLLLPGTPVIYYGDEIGMEDMDVPWELLQDTAGVNAGPDRYKLFSRDPERTPMQWSYAKNAGFSTANRTWLPINPNFVELNVECQRTSDKLSHLKIFQQLTEARKQEAIISGTLELQVFNKTVLAFSRVKEGTPGYLVITNFAAEKIIVDLTKLSHVPEESTVYTFSTTYENTFTPKQMIKNSELELPGKGGIVLIFIPEFPGLIPV